MTGRLLNRQTKLLEYLTSGRAVFGDARGRIDPTLAGIDRGLLDLEARFSHEKRMEKIAGVFPETFARLGTGAEALVRQFAEACPPHGIGRIENARQFHAFLVERHMTESLEPPCLADVSACELACAEARMLADAAAPEDDETADAARPAIRRHRGVVLLRTAFDVRSVFEDGDATPAERDTCLAVAWVSGGPHVLELTPEVFGLLAALQRWTALDGLPEAGQLVDDLTRSGLLELRR